MQTIAVGRQRFTGPRRQRTDGVDFCGDPPRDRGNVTLQTRKEVRVTIAEALTRTGDGGELSACVALRKFAGRHLGRVFREAREPVPNLLDLVVNEDQLLQRGIALLIEYLDSLL